MNDWLLTDAGTAAPRTNAISVSSITDATVQPASQVGGRIRNLGPSFQFKAVEPTVIVGHPRLLVPGEERDYLLSYCDALIAGEPLTRISPNWFHDRKQRLALMTELPANWDSFGARSPSTAAVRQAEDILVWFAVPGVPPPDVFPTSEGGVQIEWHINGLDAEIIVGPAGTPVEVYYHDLRSTEEWERPLSSGQEEIRSIRSRLLPHGERRV